MMTWPGCIPWKQVWPVPEPSPRIIITTIAKRPVPHRSMLPSGRGLATILLLVAFAWSLAGVEWGSGVFHPGGGNAVRQFLLSIVQPALSQQILLLAARESWRTLAYAIAGTSLAVVLALPLGVLASGVVFRQPGLQYASVAAGRGIAGFLRAIHELVWAWIFVAAIGLTPFAAVFALALPYAGILARILADILVDVPPAPLTALRAAGAGEGQVLLYGRLPPALPGMVSYILYRFECAIRSAAIMSFVGLGGLGYQIQISLDDLKYDEVWTFVIVLIVLVVAVDSFSAAVRRRMTG